MKQGALDLLSILPAIETGQANICHGARLMQGVMIPNASGGKIWFGIHFSGSDAQAGVPNKKKMLGRSCLESVSNIYILVALPKCC